MRGSYQNFRHVEAPTVMKPIADYIAAASGPVTLGDIVKATGFMNTQVARTMPRLIDKGVVRICGKRERLMPVIAWGRHPVTRVHQDNLYEWVKEEDDDGVQQLMD